jgi:hypothetical protein
MEARLRRVVVLVALDEDFFTMKDEQSMVRVLARKPSTFPRCPSGVL